MPMHDDQNNIKTIDITLDQYDEATKLEIIKQIKRKERQRRFFVCICAFVAILSLSYFVFYYYMSNKTSSDYNNLANLIGSNKLSSLSVKPLVNKIDQDAIETPDVMEKYSALYNKNKRLIGWLKIDDTLIDYPVMQTSNNEYYLEYNFNQEYDKNGSIFLDASCDIVNRNTNLILYGHNMKSGKMFGGLDKYSSKSYYSKHRYIQFDSIYEEGTYEIMYVFRSQILTEEAVQFKYYQFFDAASEVEFESNMQEMSEMSLYDTGVTAEYGDELLTLSTCDYQEENGRFVVVAKRIK